MQLVIMLVQNNKKELKNLIGCVTSVFPKDIVVGFDNPVHAIKYAQGQNVDVCFADIEMKNTSGFQLSEVLRNQNKNIKVNLIADKPDYALEAWRFHVNDYLLKPVTQEAILHTVSA